LASAPGPGRVPRFGSRPVGAAFWRSAPRETLDTVTLEGWMWGLILPLVLLPALTLEVRKLVLARRRVAETA